MPPRIFLSPPHVGERERALLLEAFDSNYIAPVGPHLERFEAAFREATGFPAVVAVSSGTAAMHLVLHHLGVGPGDVVLASTLTFIGSVAPAHHLGAELIFVDSSPDTWNLDPELLEEELVRLEKAGRLPKAVIPTELYGQPSDLDRLLQICASRGIPLVVDAAEALGSTYRGKTVGRGARAAIFSFNGNKILTTSGGGLLASEDRALIDHARYLATQTRDPVPHFEHREVGYNFRLSNLCAAVGIGQLEALEDRVRLKRQVHAQYQEALGSFPGLEFMPEAPWGRSNRWLTVLTVSPERFGADREQIRLALEEGNIESRPLWKPMHQQPAFRQCRAVLRGIADELFRTGLCLPSGTAMPAGTVERVEAVFREVAGKS